MFTAEKAASLIFCCLIEEAPIPIHSHILDRALKLACDKNIFPRWFRQGLRFTEIKKTGVRCPQLSASIIPVALSAKLVACDSINAELIPRTTEAEVENLLLTLQISREEFLSWQSVLQVAMAQARRAYADSIRVVSPVRQVGVRRAGAFLLHA